MGSAVNELVNGYSTDTPVSFNDYYNAYGRDKFGNGWTSANPYGILGKISNFFGGTRDSAMQEYENYLKEYENRRNVAMQQAEWAREDSAVQRAIRDIQAAGLNPWLALNGGSMSSAVNASQSTPVRYQTKEQQLKASKAKSQASSLLSTAAKLIMFLAIMG